MNIYVRQISEKLRGMFSEHLVVGDISLKDSHRDQKIVSRCLAAFGSYCLSSADEVASAGSVIDGKEDNGIDSIYFDRVSKSLVVTQSKWIESGKGCPDRSSVIKFCSGVKDLLAVRRGNFKAVSDASWASIEEALRTHGVRITMNLVYTGNAELSSHIKEEVDKLLGSVNERTPILLFRSFSLGDIYGFLASEGDDVQVDIDLSFAHWGLVKAPYCAYYGSVAGKELAQLWSSHGDRLFSRNLRRRLRSPINDRIAATSLEEPAHFWYFNNGVTIICDSLEKAAAGGGTKEIGLFKLRNAAVVNGAQTVSSLGSMHEVGHALDEVLVQVRIIEVGVDGGEFGDRVTQFNNYQNKIEPRDLMAQETNQRRLRRELSFQGYEYKIQRGEFIWSEQVIDLEEATQALVCASEDISHVVTAKLDPEAVWNQKFHYRRIYNSSLTGLELISKVKFMRHASSWRQRVLGNVDNEFDRIILNHGDLFIIFLLFEHARSEGLWSSSSSDRSKDEIESFLDAKGPRYLQLIKDFVSRPANMHMIAIGFKSIQFAVTLRDYCVRNFGNHVVQQALLDLKY